ncbi:MAG: hypothetical protein P4L75_06295 [Clostridia bacterium]|nr:hypothetical protein [Clostridia bacterium]
MILMVLMSVVAISTSCSSMNTSSSGTHAISSEMKEKMGLADTNSTGSVVEGTTLVGGTQSQSPSSKMSLADKAVYLGSTKGRVALAIIINRLDSTQVVDDLAKKSALELFTILQNTAPQKSQTLEGLDRLYDLHAILASEGIYVTIQANDAVSAKSSKQNDDWVKKFEVGINSRS